VTDPYSRHPALTAMAMATLDEISARRAVLGIGAGVSGFREMGVTRARSGVALREAVELIRRLLAGERVTYRGEVIRLEDGKLDFTPVRADLPIYIASQHPVGCRAAGRVADGAIMQGCVAEPLLTFFRETVRGAARAAGRDPSAIELVARINVCIHDDRRVARDVMRPGIVRSLASQKPDFFTFVTAGLKVPPSLEAKLAGISYAHDPGPLAAAAGEVTDDFVDAVTLTGPPDVVAADISRLVRGGIGQIMIYPMAPDGRIEPVIERFQREVIPRVRA
jgi:5,10-methylenetetrahydromethanopterin reductase